MMEEGRYAKRVTDGCHLAAGAKRETMKIGTGS